MAVETRAFIFTVSDDVIQPMTSVTVPTVRTYIGASESNGGPVLYVRGDWSLTTTTVDWDWVSLSSLPTTDLTVATYGSTGWGFYGVCVET